jgi:hypothetical protein
VLRKDIRYLGLDVNRYAPPVEHRGAAATRPGAMTPPRGFRRTLGWKVDGTPIPGHAEAGYLLSTVLGVTAGRGNTVDEIRRMIRRSVAADGIAPKGTIYYMLNTDVRATTRKWGFRPTIEALTRYGVKGEVVDGILPRGKADVAGVMAGIATFDWRWSGSATLPGAICENLTSEGGVMFANGGQTCISEFVRAGAAGTSGAVMEPFAIQEKFPTPYIHAYYAAGCTLAEAYYQSVSGPYQLLIIGDPLCAPWLKPPEVTVAVKEGEALKGTVELRPGCKGATGAFEGARFELYVDGVAAPSAERLDTTALADGYHELQVVAVGGGAIAPQAHRVVGVTVANHGGAAAVDVRPAARDGRIDLTGRIEVSASLPGARRLALVHNGRELAVVDGESGVLAAPAAAVGAGPVSVRVVATVRDGGDGAANHTLASSPIALRVGP